MTFFPMCRGNGGQPLVMFLGILQYLIHLPRTREVRSGKPNL